jgi:phospholipid/cholesterol/gamma-HCH transport system substrate-binding protein
MKKETKIGILAIIALALFIWGFQFIKGKNLLSTSNVFYVEYQNAEMMLPSTKVVKNGLEVGTVIDIYLKPGDPNTIVAVLDVQKEIKLPKDAKAVIVTTGFMGDKAVFLEFDRDCSGPDCAKSGDYLIGQNRGMLESMLDAATLESYTAILSAGLSEVLDTLNQKMLDPDSDHLLAQTMVDLQGTMSNLNKTTGQLDRLIGRSSNNIESTLANLEGLTTTLESNSEKIQSILTSTEKTLKEVADAHIGNTLNDAGASVESLKETLATLQPTIQDLSTIIAGLKSGEGTLGMLITDDSLYHNLNRLSTDLDAVLMDLEAKPYRYIPFKSRSKVKRYDKKDDTTEY